MSPAARTVAFVYIVLLLVLAGLGAMSQQRYRHQARLLEAKEEALVDLAARRAEAGAVNGPLAITTWARTSGMVPAPEAPLTAGVAPGLPAPTAPALLPPTLEVMTVWR